MLFVSHNRFLSAPCSVATAVAALFLAATPQAAQAQVVAPNVLASTEGALQQNTLNNASARTYQTQIAASQLTGFSTGSQIGGISFRLDNASPAPTADLTFASYQVTLSQAANSIGNFSTTFASNIGASAATVYNNALTFTAASYGSGATGTTPNAFGPTITFSSAYTYQGGDLVITVRQSGNSQAQSPYLDATGSAAQGYGTAIVADYSSAGQNATTADSTNGFATVLRLNNAVSSAAAPEPGSLALLTLAGMLAVGRFARRRQKAA